MPTAKSSNHLSTITVVNANVFPFFIVLPAKYARAKSPILYGNKKFKKYPIASAANKFASFGFSYIQINCFQRYIRIPCASKIVIMANEK